MIAGSLATFLGLFSFLAFQIRQGKDPALGKQVAAAPAPRTKHVLVKRIEHRIVVTKILPPRRHAATQVAAAPPPQSAPVVVQRSAPAAPAPAPASPAPVVTRSS